MRFTENKHIEYKQKVTPELEKEVVAFLNSNEGGIIYIGMDENGKSIELKNIDQEQLLLKDRLKNNILPSCLGLFDIIIEKIDEKEIIKLIVAGGYEKPYYIKKYGMSEKGAFIRVGSASEPMPTRQIEYLFSRRTRNSIAQMKSPKQELRFQQLLIYYQSIGKNLNEQFARNLELKNDDGDFNYVAYLLNDINNISIKVARYSGLNRVDLVESNEYGYESLIKATYQVLEKLNLENKTLTQITPKARKEQRLWNAIALREAVINAFVHNDYTREVAPKFEIFDDRLEITSYGSLPQGLSEEEFFEGFSILRNKELMRIFKDLDLVEQLGSGIPRILESYNKDCFHFSENFLRVVLPSGEVTNVKSGLIGGLIESQQKASDLFSKTETAEQRLLLLNEHNEQIWKFLIEDFGITSDKLRNNFGITSDKQELTFLILYLNPGITAEEIAPILNVSSRTIETYLKKLRDVNLIERIGSKKSGHWKIKKIKSSN